MSLENSRKNTSSHMCAYIKSNAPFGGSGGIRGCFIGILCNVHAWKRPVAALQMQDDPGLSHASHDLHVQALVLPFLATMTCIAPSDPGLSQRPRMMMPSNLMSDAGDSTGVCPPYVLVFNHLLLHLVLLHVADPHKDVLLY